MSDMVCRKSMMRCQTPGMCSPHGGCRDEVTTANPATVLALIAENERLKGPHDWLAEDLIKELVDNAQAIQENADDGEDDPFVIVLLASASRIRRQEANIDKLRAENERLAKTADCWDRLNVQNKALSDSFRAERDQLKAEVAGLRTGYEAYEQVNAELKAENERLERNRDMWKGQVERQAEEMTALRKDADRYRWLRVKQTFIWLIQDWLPSNAVLTDVDAEIDAAMSKRAQSRAT